MRKKKRKKKRNSRAPQLFRIKEFPPVTIAIILVNLFMFFYFAREVNVPPIFNTLVLSPYNLFVRKNFSSIIVSGFLHNDLTHLLLNMLGVFIFGTIIENRFGSFKTVAIYLGALLISMSFSILIYTFILEQNIAIIGASGALMGLIACAMLSDPFLITYETLIPLPVMIKGWLFIYADLKGFLGGETRGISHLAHLMGFLSVGFIFYFMNKDDKKVLRSGLWINIISFAAFLAARYYFDLF